MKIKKFQADTFAQALTLVRREFGADAVILSSEDRKQDKRYVEITAAIDYDTKVVESHENTNYSSVSDNCISQLHEEIISIRNYIESMKNCGFGLSLQGEKRRIFEYLRQRAIQDEFAMKIIERASDIDEVTSIICRDLNVADTPGNAFLSAGDVESQREKKIIMLIGPTGVGKTTTVAKLASMAIRNRKKVGLVSLDTFKIGAAEQIKIYSRMIGIPLKIVSDKAGFIDSIKKYTDRDVILVDTTGHNPRDTEYMNSLRNIYETGLPIETHLLLSTSSDSDFLAESHRYYGELPVHSMAFTKTDEAVRLGSIYNLSCLYQRPIAYVTTGQRVPGNIEFMDRNKLTNLILRTGSA